MSDVRVYLVRGSELTEETPEDRVSGLGKWRVVLYADHLAALERVRVETLREVWAAVNREQAWSLSDAQMQTKCLAAIDRIIDATTTPLEVDGT